MWFLFCCKSVEVTITGKKNTGENKGNADIMNEQREGGRRKTSLRNITGGRIWNRLNFPKLKATGQGKG